MKKWEYKSVASYKVLATVCGTLTVSLIILNFYYAQLSWNTVYWLVGGLNAASLLFIISIGFFALLLYTYSLKARIEKLEKASLSEPEMKKT